ncbi:MAG: hypothetical protein AAGA67_06685 [Cyanobacteria bacterium P01_F01_bin.153]
MTVPALKITQPRLAIAPTPSKTNWSALNLESLEKVYSTGVKAFVEGAIALSEISERRLYRDLDFSRFEDYCNERWGISKAQGDRMVKAGKIARAADFDGNDFEGLAKSAFFAIGGAETGDQAKRAITLFGKAGRATDMKQAIAAAATVDDEAATEWSERISQLASNRGDREKAIRQVAFEIAREEGGGRIQSLTLDHADQAAERLAAQDWDPSPKAISPRRAMDAYYTNDPSVNPVQRLGAFLEPLVMGNVLECCNGMGHISSQIQQWSGVTNVVTNDLNTQLPAQHHLNAAEPDLWEQLRQDHVQCNWVFSNPPYGKLAAPIVRQALDFAGIGVAMLLRLSFQEPCNDRRQLLNDYADRMSIIYTDGRTKFTGDSAEVMTTAWFVWTKGDRLLPPFIFPHQ